MPFKSTLFCMENQTVLPIYERCEALTAAGKTEQVISVLILCRKLWIAITPATLAEGEPGQQTNNSVAGMSAAIMAPKLALAEIWPHVLVALAEQGRTWESLFVFTNTHDPINGCTRCGDGPIGELCCPRGSMLEELSLQLLEHGKRNDGLESVAFVGFSKTPGLMADRFASFFDAFSPANRPDHPKFWRQEVEAMVQFARSSSDAMAASLLVLLEALEIADLPTCDEFARASYAKMVELKLRDTPRLGSLPEYDATRDFKADAKQRSIAASDSSLRFWNEQRRLKALGLPNVHIGRDLSSNSSIDRQHTTHVRLVQVGYINWTRFFHKLMQTWHENRSQKAIARVSEARRDAPASAAMAGDGEGDERRPRFEARRR